MRFQERCHNRTEQKKNQSGIEYRPKCHLDRVEILKLELRSHLIKSK